MRVCNRKTIVLESEKDVMIFRNIVDFAEKKLKKLGKEVEKDWLLSTTVGEDMADVRIALSLLKREVCLR